jgi:hypothetical protein
MSEFDDLYETESIRAPKTVADLFLENLLGGSPKGTHAAAVMKSAFVDDISGDLPSASEALMGYDKAQRDVQELQKMYGGTTVRERLLDNSLEILAKSGAPGLRMAKDIRAAGGVIQNGLKQTYELFFDKFLIEERKMVEKAIEMLDIDAFHQLLRAAFAR